MGALEQPVADGFGHYLWPPTWIGDPPAWATHPEPPVPINLQDLAEVVSEAAFSDGTEVRAFKDGLIGFRFADPGPLGGDPDPLRDFDVLAEHRVSVARLMNAHLACIHSGSIPMKFPQPIVPERLLHIEFEAGRFQGGAGLLADGRLWMGRFNEAFAETFENRMRMHSVPKQAMDDSFERLAALLASPKPEAALLRAELILKAGDAYANHDHPGALTNAWTAAEALANDLLLSYLDELQDRPTGDANVVFMNSDRRLFLKGSAVTARLTAEFLSLADRISFETYQGIRKSAKARNDWLHKQEAVTPEQAGEAIQTASRLFEQVESVRLEIPLGRQLH